MTSGSIGGSTSDLALIAERRAGLAAIAGLLLLEEPGPELAGLVEGVEALAPLGRADPVLRAEYARLFVSGVPLYESVFRSADGQHGGAALNDVVAAYERAGFTEHGDRRWRVAGVDHLGLELRCVSHLCHIEATAWRSGTPDEAMRAVEAEREFLAAHVAAWAPVALAAARELAGDGPYADALDAIGEFLDEEYDRLRPAPDLGAPDAITSPLPTSAGSARTASMLLAPSRCGAWLSTETLRQAAATVGMPWRPSDTRAQFRHVLAGADDPAERHLVLEPVVAALDTAARAHCDRAHRVAGNAANARHDAAVATAMARWLERPTADDARRLPATEALTLTADDPDALDAFVEGIVERAREAGVRVDRG